MFDTWCLVVGGLMLLMALGHGRIKGLPISTSMIYLGAGIVLGPWFLGWLRFDPIGDAKLLEGITEVGVLVSLFVAGLKLRTHLHDRIWHPPLKLATLGMLMTVGMVALFVHFAFGMAWGMAVLLGAILAPTDPVLASDVQVENTEDRDKLRFSLTGESGLNDGSAFPMVMLGLGLMGLHDLGTGGWRWMAIDVLWATSVGLLIGWTAGNGFARLTLWLRKRRRDKSSTDDYLAIGLIALSYGLALKAESYGFLAVFAAGLAMRHTEMSLTADGKTPTEALEEAQEGSRVHHEETAPAHMAETAQTFTEALERILEFGIVLLLGAMLPYAEFSWRTALLAAALFLVFRPLAVALTLAGDRLGRQRKRLIAWFGVRGVGSIYYLAYAIEHGVPEAMAKELTGFVIAVVVASLLAHGITVTPLIKRYEDRTARKEAASAS
ncbi:sodium:proton antiporter [bacterium]|nr:MAG: sodium:proton antiporter [bacterium]